MVKKIIPVALGSMLLTVSGCATVPATHDTNTNKKPVQTSSDPVNTRGQSQTEVQSMPFPDSAPAPPEVIPPERSTVFNSPVAEQQQQSKRSAAVVALLNQSHRAEQEGDLGRAAASIERSLRISPHDASLWYRLAQLRFVQGLYRQAISLAEKSNNLGTGYVALIRKNWLIIADSYAELGDGKSSQIARKNAQKY